MESLRAAAPVLVLLVAAPLLPPPLFAQPEADPAAAFDAYAAEAREDWGVTGLAVAVVRDGEVLLAKGYGVRELGGQPVDEHTLFAIGSTTKAMTAALLGQLVAAGELDWDDPVEERLPGFRLHDPYASREVTVRDLLTHRAGLGNADLLWYGADRTREEILAKLALVEPAYSFRGGYVYQNLMYAAAGELAARVAGAPWEELVDERLFEPLGMDRTAPTLALAGTRDNVASPHHEIDGEVRVIENEPVDPVAPAGSVWSSVSDLSRWLRMLLAEGRWEGAQVLAEETVAELLHPQTVLRRDGFYPVARLTDPHWITYGLGWFQQDYRGRMVHFHTGSIDGMSAIVGLVPEAELGIAVLANLDHAELRHALLWRAIDTFTGADEARDWSAEVKELYDGLEDEAETRESEALAERVGETEPSLPAAGYAGAYAHPLYDEVEVREEDGRLRLLAGPRRTADLEHWHYDTFRAHWDREWQGSTLVTFALGPDGEPARLWLMGLGFERVPDEEEEPSPPEGR
ncbi:MAG TPA: serine hydrolase [Thermoanaerobaculia bacterium]